MKDWNWKGIGKYCFWLAVVSCAFMVAYDHDRNDATPQHVTHDVVAPTNVYEHAKKSVVAIEQDGRIIGTGFVVRRGSDTYVWTAAHVLECDPLCEVDHKYTISQRIEYDDIFVGRTHIDVKIIKSDPEWDIALLETTIPLPVPGLSFSQHSLRIGSPIFHIGNMYGVNLEDSLTFGYISKLNREASLWPHPLDQVDMVVAPGSSGGPAFNMDGEVIGIVVGAYPGTAGLVVPVRDIVRWARANDLLFALYTIG